MSLAFTPWLLKGLNGPWAGLFSQDLRLASKNFLLGPPAGCLAGSIMSLVHNFRSLHTVAFLAYNPFLTYYTPGFLFLNLPKPILLKNWPPARRRAGPCLTIKDGYTRNQGG